MTIENKHSKLKFDWNDLYQLMICLFDVYHQVDGKGMLPVVEELLNFYDPIVDKVTYEVRLW
jgi:hypothetical protein